MSVVRRSRLHVHEAEVVGGGGGGMVAVSGRVVAGQEQLRPGRAVLERRGGVGGRWRRLHCLRQTGKVELVRVPLAVDLFQPQRHHHFLYFLN